MCGRRVVSGSCVTIGNIVVLKTQSLKGGAPTVTDPFPIAPSFYRVAEFIFSDLKKVIYVLKSAFSTGRFQLLERANKFFFNCLVVILTS